MTQQLDIGTRGKRSLPIAGQELDIDAELRAFEREERARLGLEKEEQWLEEMANLTFTKQEKGNITLLIGGLTMAHDYLVEGAFKSLGYNVVALDCPDNDALRLGKEFGNRGQCNPTYFTVGNLIKVLTFLRDDKGLSTQQIIDDYVFLTAGACGPCRFGMYVTEYRKALRDAGFDGFRVMLFQQQGGLEQATGQESGLELNTAFFLALVKGLVAGDVINALAYRLRPYEQLPGSTDAAVQQAKEIVYRALHERRSVLLALRRARAVFQAVALDRTRVKPRVSIIGEFWAMTTEGDGNYALQRFLESEGAECDIQLVSAWILYNIWEVRFDTKNRALLKAHDGGKYGLQGSGEYGVLARRVGLWAADHAVRAIFQTFAWFGGLHGYQLPDMDEVAAIAAGHYDNDVRGGEGHMEVGKLILNVVHQKATMTLSVKPFGCMPSSGVSDGIQTLITEKYPGTIYCAVETSGDGAVNFYSRVQMYLFKAKQAAQAEFEAALGQVGLTAERFAALLEAHPELRAPSFRAPHAGACTATDLVHAVARYDRTTPWERRLERLRRVGEQSYRLGARAARGLPGAASTALTLSRTGGQELLEIVAESAPRWRASAVDALRARAQRWRSARGVAEVAAG